jgi:hypothetical protein
MDAAPLPDLASLDREALLALLHAHQEELRSLAASHEDELRSLETHRQTLSQQDEQLRSSSEQIEHLKLIIEELKRRMFGVKSEKILFSLSSSNFIWKSWSPRRPRWSRDGSGDTGRGT